MSRLAVSLVALLALMVPSASGARSQPSVLLDRLAATADDAVTARIAGHLAPMRLYLVPRAIAGTVRGRFDSRIHFVGEPRPDARGRLRTTFTVPPLESGGYAVGVYCPGCRPAFRVSLRPLLRVTMPAATPNACPTTRPNGPGGRYGNGLLSVYLPVDGLNAARLEPDGSLFDKLGWTPRRGFQAEGWLTVSGRRLDAPSPRLRVIDVNWGGAGSWASAVQFPAAGCWKLTGRAADAKLSYVVKVVPG